MLGLDWKGSVPDSNDGADGFVGPSYRTSGTICTFKHSPVGFLKVYLSKVRRNCKGIERTHMGKVLDAVLLKENEFWLSSRSSPVFSPWMYLMH